MDGFGEFVILELVEGEVEVSKGGFFEVGDFFKEFGEFDIASPVVGEFKCFCIRVESFAIFFLLNTEQGCF